MRWNYIVSYLVFAFTTLFLLWRILWYVSHPRKLPCPQCNATGRLHIDGVQKKSVLLPKCPYCGGTKEVWR